MAFGFIKKVFSFGKKDGASDAAEAAAAPAAPIPAAEAVPPPADPVPLQTVTPSVAPASAAHSIVTDPELEAELAADGVFQPTPETRPDLHDADGGPVHTPEPLSDEPEPVLHSDNEMAFETAPAEEAGCAPNPEEFLPDIAPPQAALQAGRSSGKVTVSKTVEAPAEPQAPSAPEKPKGWFQRLTSGLSRSSQSLTSGIGGIFTKRKLDEDTLQDLEDVLIQADLGMETAMRITDALSASRYGKDVSGEEVRAIMAAEVEKVLGPVACPLELDLSHKPHVILVVGVNGTGKTTTIGKLAAKLTAGGLKVTLAAGDTFRAAAIEQLHIWGKRTGSPVISSKLGADAAGLAYDAFEKAREAGSDVLIIDTAGRLQNKAELMEELAKVVRVLAKLDPEAPHTVLQTLDATTGQNAMSQVEIFRNVAGVSGLVMTKLDGTARGGILVAIAAKFKLPVWFIGVGEGIDDLEPFEARDFARAIAGLA